MEYKFLDIVLNDPFWWIIISTMFIGMLIYSVKLILQLINKTVITKKQIEILLFMGSLAFLTGVLAQITGFISALDAIIRAADISFAMVVEALKISFYLPSFGIFILIISLAESLIFKILIKH